jgi:HSP20 family protein
MNATTIDETIERVEQLYTTLTGTRPPHANGNGAPIPPETDPAAHVQEQLGRMVSAIDGVVPPRATPPAWIPRAVAWSQDGDLLIAVDVPGVSREHLQIRVDASSIIVAGRRAMPWARLPKSILGCDAPLGAFARTFQLAGRIDPKQVGVRLDDGVLTVRVYTTTRPEPSQIPISS